MATVTKSAATSNSLSNSTDFRQLAQEIEWHLEEGYLYPSAGLRNTIEDLKRRVNRAVPGKARENAKSDLDDQEVVLAMSELIEAFPDILRSAHVANQLKQDYDHVLNQLAEAVESATVNDTLPDEVPIEILGDIILPSATLDNCRVEFERMDAGEAVYSVHCL